MHTYSAPPYGFDSPVALGASQSISSWGTVSGHSPPQQPQQPRHRQTPSLSSSKQYISTPQNISSWGTVSLEPPQSESLWRSPASNISSWDPRSHQTSSRLSTLQSPNPTLSPFAATLASSVSSVTPPLIPSLMYGSAAPYDIRAAPPIDPRPSTNPLLTQMIIEVSGQPFLNFKVDSVHGITVQDIYMKIYNTLRVTVDARVLPGDVFMTAKNSWLYRHKMTPEAYATGILKLDLLGGRFQFLGLVPSENGTYMAYFAR